MNKATPYIRAFACGAVWFSAVALKMISRHPGDWTTYPLLNLLVLVVGWTITAGLLGAIASRYERLRSWPTIVAGTVVGSLVVLGTMLLIVNQMYSSPPRPQFRSTDAMMEYFAAETAKWVKKDRGVDLDYSLDSIKVIEEELGRISQEVDHANPQRGTRGLAMGYGAYIGEVFRRRDGGSWAVDHPDGGPKSYPLTTRSNVTILPVGWCWRRITVGEEDNVYQKALYFSQAGDLITNAAAGGFQTTADRLRTNSTSPAARTRR